MAGKTKPKQPERPVFSETMEFQKIHKWFITLDAFLTGTGYKEGYVREYLGELYCEALNSASQLYYWKRRK